MAASMPEGYDAGTPEPRITESKNEKRERIRASQRESYHRNKNKPKVSLPMLSRIKFCPECGCNLEIFNIALGMAEKAQRP
jgi:hypothetical protein